MTQIIKAIYEQGILRPLEPLALPVNAQVQVTIETPSSQRSVLNGCIGSVSARDAEEMKAIIESTFERVDERDW